MDTNPKQQFILKFIQKKLVEGKTLENISLAELFNELNGEIEQEEKVIKAITESKEAWVCRKCKKDFNYCWCNPSIN